MAVAILFLDRLFALVVVIILLIVIFGLIGGLPDEIGSVEEGTLLGANVYEGGLNSGEYCVNPAQVNVTDHASVVWTIG
jgi:hypothetical protein